MSLLHAHAKINLALVVGPLRVDGRHRLATVLQRIGLHDDVALEPAEALAVDGFADDTLVRDALEALARTAGVEPLWRATLEKRIPVAAGLGGGSSDAAAALRLANTSLAEPLSLEALHRIAARIGADVPFFLREGAQLATGDGTTLRPVELPRGHHVLLVLPHGESKTSTGDVYRAFDERGGGSGFDGRRGALEQTLARVTTDADLAALPPNDLVSSPLAARLAELGAFRADVSGAGPTLYGLFDDEAAARRARDELAGVGRTWLTRPV